MVLWCYGAYMPQTYSSILLHVVFSTTERAPFIVAEIRERLHAYMAGIINDRFGYPLQIGGTEDHVHVFLNLRPTEAISDAMRVVKACSSKWVHEELKIEAFDWQDGFGVFSVSESNKHQVIEYIANQEEHHRSMDSMQEYVFLLGKHGMKHDGRNG